MLTTIEARDLIDSVFEEQAIALGGLIAARRVEDDVVWSLVRILDAIRGRALVRTACCSPDSGEPASPPHPAIREFLARLGPK